MYLNCTFELTLTLDSEKFNKLLTRVLSKLEHLSDEEYIERSLESKGIIIKFRDSQYKKKIKLFWMLDDEEDNISKAIHKLDKRIGEYFNSNLNLNLHDFTLTGLFLTTELDVGNRIKTLAYLKVLKRLGRVKGFSPAKGNDNIRFQLEGNSNGIMFFICDLAGLLKEKLQEAEHGRKQLKAAIEKSEGLLRAEVRLTKAKAIRTYSDNTNTSAQIIDLYNRKDKVFLDIFMRVIPFGNFHKKSKAEEIIRREVKDQALRRRMLHLLALVPEKKSLLLAQKALNYRKVDDIMEAFADIEVSPVTLSKRHDIKKLDNLYKYL